MSYVYKAVDRLPKSLSEGVVYHSEEFEVGALLCACGCGHRVSLLVPDSHQITFKGELATIRPSISVCDAPCKSHYIINNGEVDWMPAFSDGMAAATMQRQIIRHAVTDHAVSIPIKKSWIGRIQNAIGGAFLWFRSLFRQ